ncbi:MAG: hypothetical protein M1826_003401 [Phylliscum demangeonii]|nr:MAG: hypothetical protein M1826_003401 [Phylliscum demangeonii]
MPKLRKMTDFFAPTAPRPGDNIRLAAPAAPAAPAPTPTAFSASRSHRKSLIEPVAVAVAGAGAVAVAVAGAGAVAALVRTVHQHPVDQTCKLTGSLLDETEKDARAEADVARARALLVEPDPEADAAQDGRHKKSARETATTLGSEQDESPGGLLASVVDGQSGSGDWQKVMHAMQRTEALQQPKTWRFFRVPAAGESGAKHRLFPVDGLPAGRWRTVLRAARFSYTGGLMIILVISLPGQVHRLFNPAQISQMFQALGGTTEAVNIESAIHPVPDLQQASKGVNRANAVSVVAALEAVSSNLGMDAIEHAICILGRLTLDASVIDEAELVQAVGGAYESLIESIADDDWEESLTHLVQSQRIGSTLFQTIIHLSTRLQLLTQVPSSTARVRLFRQRLALAFLFNDTSYLRRPGPSLLHLPDLTHHLQTDASFRIHPDTDYATLAARSAILDLAIGNARCSIPIPVSTAPATATATAHANPPSASVRGFNKEVDALAAAVWSLFTQIVDSGASHMTRTEAKEVLNRLHSRLTYTVRTRPKPKKALFQSTAAAAEGDAEDGGDGDGDGESARAGPLSKWFTRGPAG